MVLMKNNIVRKVAKIVEPQLKKMGFEVIVGKLGRVLTWRV